MGRHEGQAQRRAPGGASSAVEIGLTAAILSVSANEPRVLVVRNLENGHASDGLPFGPFSPLEHRTLDMGLRSWVKRQTELDLGYVEQLYTFGDRGRHAEPGDTGPHIVSIGYLALTRDSEPEHERNEWRSWYHYFPWEDRRNGAPSILDNDILPRLNSWALAPLDHSAPARPIDRAPRVARRCRRRKLAGLHEDLCGL